MRYRFLCATASLALLATGPAAAQSTEVTIWSWDVAASALKSTLEGFNRKYPDIKVTVQDLGNKQVFDKTLAGCAAGGDGLPAIVTT